ncbi:Cys-tRNA(Pro) deacylase [Alkaliphilus sp. MSJ-5]|uniref:Cys-tRNA(Pro)/Cys-tRNA(Cys) deacylase n=1 Tax=Alkaliphilus flagellatus TaxID=2841507 RepID=A0ABS6G1F4_9FIRM|nr:Cys-tRNA(Pro) deacylase [Alkaliphilus flagellatus]MBU5675557.1 Cys-tRNA(Pro) deacylase [Alkaliphilus flagellatus]
MIYKTNVMRIFDKAKVEYKSHSYANTKAISGIDVANVLNQNPNQMFKTLVTVGKTNKYYVFLVPVADELDLKKAADSVNEKSIEMLKSKDLFSITGYIHGGCSPIGMKKSFYTTIDESARNFETIIFSAGKIGYQVEISLEELKKVISFNLAYIVYLKKEQ